jgi:hypothetical protein
MCNRIDVDSKDSRAIVREIGESLRASLKEEPETTGGEQSPSINPSAERWDKLHR